MAAVWGKRGAFVGAFTEGQLPHLARREIDDADVVAGPGAGRVGDLVERGGRPGWTIGVAAGNPLQTEAIGADDVNCGVAGAIGRERDLIPGRRPGRRRIDTGVIG